MRLLQVVDFPDRSSDQMRSANRHCNLRVYALAAFFVLPTIVPPLLSQELEQPASLRVIVQESGPVSSTRPVADALVYLQADGGTQAVVASTDAQGACHFESLNAGIYKLRIEKNGYAPLVTSVSVADKPKEVDLALSTTASVSPPAASTSTPEFFDQPRFTVSGVTDTTSIGGHGSDAVAGTRESLAKDTFSLGASPARSESVGRAASPVDAASEASLRERAEREPANFAVNRDLGQLLVADNKLAEAIPYLELASRLSSAQPPHDQAELHNQIARAQEKAGHSLESVREYQRAAEIEPSEPYLFDWGSELLLHHAPEPALEVFTKGARLFPQSVRMLMGLGAAWFASGSFDRAVEHVCRASDLNPSDPTPYEFLAKMQSTQTLTSADLVEKLRRFVALEPNIAAANYYLAVGLWKLRKNVSAPVAEEQVESLLHTAIRLNPEFGAAYLQLGVLHSEQKHDRQAIADYQHALHSDPQLAHSRLGDLRITDLQIEETHYRLAQVYREIGETAKAKAELQLYEQISKESAQQAERQRHEIGQFVYTLRDQPVTSPR